MKSKKKKAMEKEKDERDDALSWFLGWAQPLDDPSPAPSPRGEGERSPEKTK